MVVYAKQTADRLGLGCDFTFGSLWPFGDTKVPFDEAAMTITEPKQRQEIGKSWEYPKKGYVLDHLNRNAFFHYAQRTGDALRPALRGSVSGLFCDSWEVEAKFITTPGFDKRFKDRYGYSLSDHTRHLYSNREPYRSVRYDYMKLVSQYAIEEFYKPFTQKCHELGAYSRVQCNGSPTDIISAYSTPDVPETEAILYEPTYANIVASAAALAGKPLVTSETFTCLYGWPADHQSKEQTADLKMLADAQFANGVNHIIWHGKPFNHAGKDTDKFYASVHVGPSGSLAAEIPAFNRYMEKVSSCMRKGATLSGVAVYLPTEDAWIAGELPREKQLRWSWGAYEQRSTYLPEELKAWRPLWINGEFLKKAKWQDEQLRLGDLSFAALYIDVQYMDKESLERVVELAEQGLPVCVKRLPDEPGLHKTGEPYKALVAKLKGLDNVKTSWAAMKTIPPIVTGAEKIDYWCRQTADELYVFLANPRSKNLKFPIEYGQSLTKKKESLNVAINWRGNAIPVALEFDPYQSLLLKVDSGNKATFIDVSFTPKTPVYKARVKKGPEKWEVDAATK